MTLRNGKVLAGASYKARGMHPDLPLTEDQVDDFLGAWPAILADAQAQGPA